jgi:tetratricopeptide (TPR) repeat protein
MSPSPAPSPLSWQRTLLASLLLLGAAGGGCWAWGHHAHEVAVATQEKQAQEALAPAAQVLTQAAQSPVYDLDATVRTIHEIDGALRDSKNLRDYLGYVAHHDYRDVAPEVLAAHDEVLQVLTKLYGRQTELADQQAVWALSTEFLLSAMATTRVGAGPLGVETDAKAAQKLLADFKERQKQRGDLVREISGLEGDLLRVVTRYSGAQAKYLEQWDTLCLQRDRAYLAVHDGDWASAAAAAQEAIAKAPKEREAHLLRALSLLALSMTPGESQHVQREEAGTLIDGYLKDHPGSSAPALLLRGVLARLEGHADQAKLDLEQASAMYPKQADQLADLLDPYKARTDLRKSREGSFIVELYRSTMLGAGFFSPELQQARALFDAGDFEAGKSKVLDHFSRRRQQKQWDFILSDIRFCQKELGPSFRKMLPEDTYLDLVVKPTLFGSKVTAAVHNRSQHTLHNATLVLCVNFTDMHRDDYEAFAAGDTAPAVNARETTSYGDVEVSAQVAGQAKTVKDVVLHRAILVSNEAVSWVDTDEFKIAESAEFAAQRQAAGQPSLHPVVTAPSAPDVTALDALVKPLIATLSETQVHLAIASKLGKDDVVITLPRELAILAPLFTLESGGVKQRPSSNVIQDEGIQMTFEGVFNFDDEAATRPDLTLRMDSPVRPLLLKWKPAAAGAYKLVSVE